MPYLLVPKPYGIAGYGDDGYGFWVFPYDLVQPTIQDIIDQRITPQEYSTASILIPSPYGFGGYGEQGYGYVAVGPTIKGLVDGSNKFFSIAAFPRKMRVFWNGVLQTQDYDVATGGNSILFLRSTPNAGDIVTAEVWV